MRRRWTRPGTPCRAIHVTRGMCFRPVSYAVPGVPRTTVPMSFRSSIHVRRGVALGSGCAVLAALLAVLAAWDHNAMGEIHDGRGVDWLLLAAIGASGGTLMGLIVFAAMALASALLRRSARDAESEGPQGEPPPDAGPGGTPSVSKK